MVQGSKNAALPLIAAALLCGEQTMLTNCPQIHDVEVMLSLVEELGGSVLIEGHQVVIDSHTFDKTVICQDAVKELRASVLLMGACLAKFGEVTISYPGGCSIGKRPIDFHIHAFQKMGAEIVEEEDKMICRCITPLHGAHIQLPFPSVGATENIMLASCLGEGTTQINNAAREPEIIDLQNFLNKMGAKIQGAGSGSFRAGIRHCAQVRNKSPGTILKIKIASGLPGQ